MVTSSDKSKNALVPKPPVRSTDFSLEPLPVPEVIESDSDTVWGLWEHALQGHDDDLSPDAQSDDAYDVTVAGELMPMNGEKPKT